MTGFFLLVLALLAAIMVLDKLLFLAASVIAFSLIAGVVGLTLYLWFKRS